MFLLLWFVVFLYAVRLNIINHPAFVINVVIALLIAASSFVNLGLVIDSNLYIFPDESRFSAWSQEPLTEIIRRHHRYLMYVLFSHFTYDLAGEWAFKIQSIPFALFTCLILYDATKQKNTLWLFPVIFSFLYFLATLHLRDSILICAMLFFALQVSRSGFNGVIVWSVLAILFFSVIRPEYSIVWAFILIWMYVNNFIKNRFLILVLPAITVTFLFIFFEDAIFWIANYFYPGRVAIYVADRAVELGSIPFLNDNAAAIVRQLITPLPFSKLIYMYNNEVPTRRVIYEMLRMILMVSYYFMFVAVLFKWKKAYNLLRENRFIQILFMMAVINTILYAIYRDGGGGTRNKLYPFILVYIVFINIYVFRIKKYVSNKTQAMLSSRENVV